MPLEMMRCPGCGADNSTKRAMCYKCGAILHPPVPQPRPTGTLNDPLAMSVQVVISELDAEAEAELADLDRYPLAEIVEVLDNRTCPLCRYLDGMLLDRRSPDFLKWALPPHINCRRVLAYVSSREVEIGPDGKAVPITPDFVEPPEELVKEFGHFITDPVTDGALRVMAQPAGRDFIFARVKDPETDIVTPTLFWRVEPYELPGLDPGIAHLRPEQWMGNKRLRRRIERL